MDSTPPARALAQHANGTRLIFPRRGEPCPADWAGTHFPSTQVLRCIRVIRVTSEACLHGTIHSSVNTKTSQKFHETEFLHGYGARKENSALKGISRHSQTNWDASGHTLRRSIIITHRSMDSNPDRVAIRAEQEHSTGLTLMGKSIFLPLKIALIAAPPILQLSAGARVSIAERWTINASATPKNAKMCPRKCPSRISERFSNGSK